MPPRRRNSYLDWLRSQDSGFGDQQVAQGSSNTTPKSGGGMSGNPWMKAVSIGTAIAADLVNLRSIQKRGRETHRRYKAQQTELLLQAGEVTRVGGEQQFEMVREGAFDEGAFSAAVGKTGVGGQSVRTRKRAITSENRRQMILFGTAVANRAESLRRQAREARKRGRFARSMAKRDMWGAHLSAVSGVFGSI